MGIAKRIIPAQEIEDEIASFSISRDKAGAVLTAITAEKGSIASGKPYGPGDRQAHTIRLDAIPTGLSITVNGKAMPVATIVDAILELSEAIVNHCRQEPQA